MTLNKKDVFFRECAEKAMLLPVSTNIVKPRLLPFFHPSFLEEMKNYFIYLFSL